MQSIRAQRDLSLRGDVWLSWQRVSCVLCLLIDTYEVVKFTQRPCTVQYKPPLVDKKKLEPIGKINTISKSNLRRRMSEKMPGRGKKVRYTRGQQSDVSIGNVFEQFEWRDGEHNI